jgi:ABC-2 type transport system permease protein
MSKALAVFVREYLEVVRKKSFIIMTILAPFLFAALMFIPTLLAVKGMGEKRVVVVDATQRLRQAFIAVEEAPVVDDEALRKLGSADSAVEGQKRLAKVGRLKFVYVAAAGDPKEAAKPYLDRLAAGGESKAEEKIDGVVLVPPDVFTATKPKITLYGRTAADIATNERVDNIVNRTVSRQRLADAGIDAAQIDRLLTRVSVETVKLSKTGEETKGGELDFLLGFMLIALLMIPMLIHGQEVMRGIVQEKSDRVVEILVSSMRPLQLLAGKVLGLAAVGLTQVGVWFAMGTVVALYAAGAAAAAGVNVLQFFKLSLIPYFFLFYLLGYLTYVCIYAIGGAISNSEKEAQQILGPLMLVMMVPWFLAMPILQDPESRLATVLSLIPVYTPITMFMRVVVSEPPLWQVSLSVALSVATVYAMFWVTAKIFRVGILSYGKRPTIPELARWVRVA